MIGPVYYGVLSDEKSSMIPRLLPFLLCKARHAFKSNWIDVSGVEVGKEEEGVYRFLVRNSDLLARGLLIRKPAVNPEK